jgi:hypothetical protein
MCDWLLPWNKSRVKGRLVPLRGLTLRRHREREYCITGIVPAATAGNLKHRLEAWK